MPDKSYKYFYCKPCKLAWKTEEFHTDGAEISALCPVCEHPALECTHSTYNLARTAWQNATGPKTEEGKARVALNSWKTGEYATKIRIMAPAKFEKYPWCLDCEDREPCKSKLIKYCPRDLETTAKFVAAYKNGDVNDLREEAGLANAQVWKVFSMMIHQIIEKGVMYKVVKFDSEGNEITTYEKNQLVKELPAYLASLGMSADQQVMTPKAAEQKEALEGRIKQEQIDQEEEIVVRKRAADELAKMRKLLEDRQAGGELKKALGVESSGE